MQLANLSDGGTERIFDVTEYAGTKDNIHEHHAYGGRRYQLSAFLAHGSGDDSAIVLQFLLMACPFNMIQDKLKAESYPTSDRTSAHSQPCPV